VTATIFFTGPTEIATLQNTFMVSGVPTDPTTISCVITDPLQNAVVHTYNGAQPADIFRLSTGAYQLQVPCLTTGIWSYQWTSTGTAADLAVGTWSVQPSTPELYYTSVEEIKDRLRITDTQDDMTIQMAVQAATRWIEKYCGRHFVQRTSARTYMPDSIYEVYIDDLVHETQVAVDYDGDGIFESVWQPGQDYELSQIGHDYNLSDEAEFRPYGVLRAINYAGGGKYMPFTWPFSRMNRIQITGTWGWQAVPLVIRQAAIQLAADFYKLKDAPFGVAGTGEFGLVRVATVRSLVVLDLLAPYRHPRRSVGI
jgi:hypothetical protein